MRAQRQQDGLAVAERDARWPATPAARVLALQRSAGNHAVTALLQRIPLRRDLPQVQRDQTASAEAVDRPNVAAGLATLPLELSQRLIDDIGAGAIRSLITPRLLTEIARAYANNAERILKLLDHLSDGEVVHLRQIAEDYNAAGFARFLDRHPIAVKRAIRADAANGAPLAREPGMVIVAAAAINAGDFMLHSHIDYALSHVGGTVHMAAAANLSRLDDDGTLYIVEHGDTGMVGDYGPAPRFPLGTLTGYLTHPVTGLRPTFAGKIKITACYSGVQSAPGAADSVVDAVRGALNAAGRHNIQVIGVAGPSITNMQHGSKYPVVDPARVNEAFYAQQFLLGLAAPRNHVMENTLGLVATPYGKYAALQASWLAGRAGLLTLEAQVKLAASLSLPFYTDFIALMQANRLLLPDAGKKTRQTS